MALTPAERWSVVENTNQMYEVSDFGRVKSLQLRGRPTANGLLAAVPNSKGYLRVYLTVNGHRYSTVIHRLVLCAFVGPQPSPLYECNHKNTNKADNHYSNLEWVTPVENNAHSIANGLWKPHKGEAHGRAKLDEKMILTIRSLQGKETAAEIGRICDVNPVIIRRIWDRSLWKHV